MIHTRILATLLSLFVALSAIPFVSMATGEAPASPGGGSGGSIPAVPGAPGMPGTAPAEPITSPTPSPAPLPPKQILDSRHYSTILKDGSSYTFDANLLQIKNANARTPDAVFDYGFRICKSDDKTTWCVAAVSTEMPGKISGSTWKISVYSSSGNLAFSALLDREYGRIWTPVHGWIIAKAIKPGEKIGTPTPKPAPNPPITIQSRQR
ncbi:MAG: hypothetical protein HY365_01990 [Candidatus Aenigmarchaeota archaeon]|nr:hypothetical protein [Candidatus Aenigmarchaeota archaeon]